MANYNVGSGQHVLILWASAHPPVNMEAVVSTLREQTGSEGRVQVEHAEILLQSSHPSSMFDVAISGALAPSTYIHNTDILAEVARTLKPNGKLIVREPAGGRSAEKLISTLKLSGFVKPSEAKVSQQASESIQMVEVACFKPHFEVGAGSRISIKTTQKKPVDANVAKVWTLSAMDVNDENVDIIDSDALLEDEDLVKPDPASLKSDCGTSKNGKKRACKNCTCGLAEEDDVKPGKAPVKKAVKSACGNCNLGDAFRCGGCPYAGMPPFKPGEQVLLPKSMLQADA